MLANKETGLFSFSRLVDESKVAKLLALNSELEQENKSTPCN